MTIEAYINPNFGWIQKIIFLAAAFIAIVICVALILMGVKISSAGVSDSGRRNYFCMRAHGRVQLFYEMMISATSVMSFACAYVIINHIYSTYEEAGGMGYENMKAFISIWEDWKDFVLLLLICLSCVLNSILDKLIIPLKHLSKEEKASIRLLGMFYAILILVYLNFIGDESEYSPVMMYYLGLMVGRFVYFDASFMDFIENIKNAFKNLPLLILGLLTTGALCFFGFNAGYLLERNYYIVGVFYTHLFMLLAVFIIHHSRVLNLIAGKPNKNKIAEEELYEEYDAYEEDTEQDYEEEDDYIEEDEDTDFKWM